MPTGNTGNDKLSAYTGNLGKNLINIALSKKLIKWHIR